MCALSSLLGIKGLKASRCTECPDGVRSSPRISCVPSDVQPGKPLSGTLLWAWSLAPGSLECHQNEQSPVVLAVCWAVLGTTGESPVGACLRGNLKLCPRDHFEVDHVH